LTPCHPAENKRTYVKLEVGYLGNGPSLVQLILPHRVRALIAAPDALISLSMKGLTNFTIVLILEYNHFTDIRTGGYWPKS
jgi:hypothetical protein